jgi:uncharacterized protein (TIGR03437 family)
LGTPKKISRPTGIKGNADFDDGVKWSMRYLMVCLLAVAPTLAQPALRAVNPIENSASYMPPGYPSSGIAQGSIFSVFGSGLGPAVWTEPASFPLLTTLGDTTVNVTVGSTTQSAFILGVNESQVNAIMPSTMPVGAGSLTVTHNGLASPPVAVQIGSAAFGIFTYGASGVGQAIATDAAYSINTIIYTFHPGDVGIIWGTGLGAIDASDAGLPPVGNLPGNVQVWVGDTAADVGYHGRSGCCAGLDQIVFTVPQGVEGCAVPLSVETSGGISNFTTIAVSQSGQTCTDSIMGQSLVAKLAAGQNVNFGYILLEDSYLKFQPDSTLASSQDFANGTFSQLTPGTAGLAEYGISSGYCAAVACPGFSCAVNSPFGLQDLSPAQLDAGPSLSAIWGTNAIQMQSSYPPGDYFAVLSLGERFLWSKETYTISGTGGTAVGAFNLNYETGLASTFITNLSGAQDIPRGSDLVVQWTGADPTIQNGQVVVAGYSASDVTYDQLTYFECTGAGAAGQLTIPARVLSMLPATGSGSNSYTTYPLGWIWAGQLGNPATFQATGLDLGIVSAAFFNGFGVYFQ